MTKKELILNAAKKVGCSKLTSTNYYEVEAASLEGILTEAPDTDGIMVVQFAYHNNHEDRGNGHKPHEKLKETVALVETEAKG